MSRQSHRRLDSRMIGTVVAGISVIVGLPAVLVAAAVKVLGHVSPLDGMKAPWRWTVDDVHSWGQRLAQGFESSDDLVQLFIRVALVIGWVCVGTLLYTIVDEVVFQLRHGMPSQRERRLGGFGPIGRRLATALVAMLPLSAANPAPALLGAAGGRPVAMAAVVHDLPVTVGATGRSSATLPVQSRHVSRVAGGWSVIEVQRGDSVWSIAERVSNGRDISAVADAIVRANLGAEMIDGHRFSTPALIEPGWRLTVPATDLGSLLPDSLPMSAGEADYVVKAGDSYWRIAEHHLPDGATGGQIAEYTRELMDLNAPLLGYSERKMIHPGDVVHLLEPLPVAAPEAPQPVPSEPAVVDVPAPATSSLPPPTLPPSVPPTGVTATPSALPPPVPPSVPVPGPSSTSTAPDADVAAVTAALSDDTVPVGAGLAAVTVLAGSVLAALATRRRAQLRSAHVGARLLPPPEHLVRTERQLRALNDGDRWARLDLAVRSAAPHLAAQQARVLAVEIEEHGDLRVFVDQPVMVSPPWVLDIDGGTWRLSADVSLMQLADAARGVLQPCPALVHLGDTERGQLFVDLEALGVLSIDAPPAVAAAIVRCAVASLAVSPLGESNRVFTVGIENEAQLGSPIVESLPSLAAALDALRFSAGSIIDASASSSTFALRTSSQHGDAWEPALLVCSAAEADVSAELATLTAGGGRGVGIVIDRPVDAGGAVLRADDSGFVLDPLGLRLRPVGLPSDELAAIDELLTSAGSSAIVDRAESEPVPSRPAPADRPYEFIVRVLGQSDVRSARGEVVAFDRSKALELVVWLSQHRYRPTRNSARTALWETSVRDATFSNVVSDARRALARAVQPPVGQEWIGRTMTEELPLHELVVSDAELLADGIAAARELDGQAAIDALRPGVALIEGMPFAGTSYLWPDAEGLTSSLVLLETSAAASLASLYLEAGDVDGVFWATGKV